MTLAKLKSLEKKLVRAAHIAFLASGELQDDNRGILADATKQAAELLLKAADTVQTIRLVNTL